MLGSQTDYRRKNHFSYRVFAWKYTYFSNRKSYSSAEQFDDGVWIAKLAFLRNFFLFVFDRLNELNVDVQEKKSNNDWYWIEILI
jgi:hypothetical protein